MFLYPPIVPILVIYKNVELNRNVCLILCFTLVGTDKLSYF